jgi:hypothetical protein
MISGSVTADALYRMVAQHHGMTLDAPRGRGFGSNALKAGARIFADGVDGAPNGIKRAKMVVVASAIWKGAVRGQVYHRYLVCHARRA